MNTPTGTPTAPAGPSDAGEGEIKNNMTNMKPIAHRRPILAEGQVGPRCDLLDLVVRAAYGGVLVVVVDDAEREGGGGGGVETKASTASEPKENELVLVESWSRHGAKRQT